MGFYTFSDPPSPWFGKRPYCLHFFGTFPLYPNGVDFSAIVIVRLCKCSTVDVALLQYIQYIFKLTQCTPLQLHITAILVVFACACCLFSSVPMVLGCLRRWHGLLLTPQCLAWLTDMPPSKPIITLVIVNKLQESLGHPSQSSLDVRFLKRDCRR